VSLRTVLYRDHEPVEDASIVGRSLTGSGTTTICDPAGRTLRSGGAGAR
jgi:hypothetical protein